MILTCRKCTLPKDESEFYFRRRGEIQIPSRTCKGCDNKGRGERRPSGHPRTPEERRRSAALSRSHRRDSSKAARFIVEDSRRSDKKASRENDLETEWVNRQIADGCTYCGEQNLRMTLDRIDNTLGHLQSNVVPACIRCNYLRRDMPYQAWQKLVPAIKAAREQNLFGDWTGRCR